MLLLAALPALLSGCPGDTTGTRDPQKYQKMVSAFYTGVVALRANDPDRAETNLRQATKLYPEEPAAWADLAIKYLRGRQLDQAQKSLDRARSLAPRNSEVLMVQAVLEDTQGNAQKSADTLRQVIQQDPTNLRAHALLIQQLERLAAPGSDAEIETEYGRVLEAQPGNLVALLELARIAARSGDRPKLQQDLQKLAAVSGGWPADPVRRLKELQKKAATADPHSLATDIQILGNVLRGAPQFQASAAALGRAGSADVATPLEHFLKLRQPPDSPAPPDTSITFSAAPLGSGKAPWAAAVELQPALPAEATDAGAGAVKLPAPAADAPPVPVYPAGAELVLGSLARLPVPGGAAALPAPHSMLVIDWNDDYRPDLVLPGSGGTRFFQQTAPGKWSDLTGKTGLPTVVTNSAASGAWAADFDLDGDLDVILGLPGKEPLGLQNNGDGSWKATHPFPGVTGLRDFAWADLSGDGVPDAALLDGAGQLAVFVNDRGGQFHRAPLGAAAGKALALSVADASRNGTLDLVVLRPGGAVEAVTSRPGDAWQSSSLTSWPGAPKDGRVQLFWGDLDNNGALDLVASGPKGSQVWLGGAGGALQPLPSPLDARIDSLADMDGDGRLDLVGTTKDGQPVQLVNHGSKSYHWQVLRPRNARVHEGDQKINAFGIGGEAELRAGLLAQKQPISGPVVHFGLGEYPKSDLVRITWPNGQAQGEFDLAADSSLLANQRLTGSCPWLFADDGSGMKFVTDILWKSPLGLRINAQNTAGVSQTRDWVKIRGDQLRPRGGSYDLRVTAELWETDFFDTTSLMVVDHPAAAELILDERFAIPQPELKLHLASTPLPIARALDERGADVTDLVRARDGRTLDTFPLGRYQGVARDHYVEVDLPAEAPREGPLWLLGSGWIFPTDSSINVAISQGRQEKPEGLSLEVPDGQGGWKVARRGLGFPAGKYKTVLLDLTGLFPPGSAAPWRLRLRTNMEIYWDSLAVAAPAAGQAAASLRVQSILPETAELRYRGFSRTRQPKRSTPETPEYDHLAGTEPQWLDLAGFYTRFGDVRELLAKVDDRYVIMNAGDELALRFPAPPPPPAGWTRDFVFVSDGWDKDGNFNTSYSQTVLPLPSHARPAYDTPPGRLEDDPVYRAHPEDWVKYHTRYVTADPFRNLLRPAGAGSGEDTSASSQSRSSGRRAEW